MLVPRRSLSLGAAAAAELGVRRHERRGAIVAWYIPGILLLSILPLPLLFRSIVPQKASWILALAAFASVGLAVGFFCLWEWLEYPVLAYLDGITYGCLALTAGLGLLNRRLSPRDSQANGEMVDESRREE
jgi:hypothetical protein